MDRILFLVILFGWAGHSRAQLTFHSLHEVLQYADKNSLVEKQSVLSQGIAEKDITSSKSSLLPKVNIFATGDYYPLIPILVVPEAATGGSPGKFQKVQLGLPWSFSSGVELTMPLINLARWEELKKYRLQSVQTGWDSKTNEENLHIQIAEAYYQTLLAKGLLELGKDEMVIGDELIRIMDERKNNQLVDPADFNRARNLHLDARNSVIDYEKNYELALIALRELLHLPAASSLSLEDSVSSPAWKSYPEDVRPEDRPGWKGAATRVAIAEQQNKESKKAGLPSLALNGKFTYQSQFDPSSTQHLNYSFSNIGLMLDFPIFQGNYYKAGKQKTAMQLEAAKISQQQTNDEILRQQAEWKSNYEAAIKKQVVLDEKLQLVEDNMRIARLNLKEGLMEFETFNTIFHEYIQARMGYLQNLSDGMLYKLLLTQKW